MYAHMCVMDCAAVVASLHGEYVYVASACVQNKQYLPGTGSHSCVGSANKFWGDLS